MAIKLISTYQYSGMTTIMYLDHNTLFEKRNQLHFSRFSLYHHLDLIEVVKS